MLIVVVTVIIEIVTIATIATIASIATIATIATIANHYMNRNTWLVFLLKSEDRNGEVEKKCAIVVAFKIKFKTTKN